MFRLKRILLGKALSCCAIILAALIPILSHAQLSCSSPPSGIVAWWAAEGNVYDSIGANNGTLMGGLGFASGEVGQALNFRDTNGYVYVPASSQLNVGASSGLTVEEWISPSNVTTQMPLIGWGANAGPNTNILAGPVLNPANGHYYYLLQTNTWTASEPQAVALGGHLATINDATENSWVLNTFSLVGGVYRDLWIGLYDPAGDTNTVPAQHGTNFVWSDGESATYRNWRSGEPNNGTSAPGAVREYWTYMFSSDPKVGLAGQWNDLPNYNNDTGGYSIGGVVEVLTTPGVHLWTSITWPGGGGAGCLYANLVDATNGNHQFASAPGLLHSNVYQHVALTYSTNSGIATLYLNGVSVASTNFGVFVPKTTGDVVLGKKVGGLPTDTYSGGMDEVSIYNRALSASEIQTIYNAGIAGKCPLPPTPPTITSQPVSQTNIVGTTSSFSVTAGGTQPLNYQWSYNATNIANATNAMLTLTNVQLSQSGNYSVAITNAYGSTNSVVAVLTINAPLVSDPAPTGLVAWWPAEGNANDIVGTNNGTPQNISYVAGEVGQSFVFNGTNSGIQVPASTSLNVGLQGGLTIETWVSPANLNYLNEWLAGWRVGTDGYGTTIKLSQAVGSGPPAGCIFANLIDTSGNSHLLSSTPVLSSNVFQHIALTYNKTNGIATIYLNGLVVTQQNLGSFTLQTSYPFLLGSVASSGNYGENGFGGKMDEVSLYSRALSSNEIAAIYNAGSAGKYLPPTPPTITSQPASLTNIVGTTATFSVSAGGTQPLSYQWTFNATNIANATNATLTLNNVQLSQAGNYKVAITNVYGSTNSATVVLTVNTQPASNPVPSGIVAWWPAEGNANDIISGNNGILQPGASFATGKVGQGFFLNNTNAYLRVPASESLKSIEIGSGLAIEGWIYVTNVAGFHPIAEFNDGIGDYGVQFWIGSNPADNGLLYAALVDTNGNYHQLYSPQHAIVANVFQHIALTYDKASGVGTLYVNGSVVAQSTWTNFIPQTGYDLWLGHRQGDAPGTWTYGTYLGGLLDELSIYNRGLTSNEIAGIYNAGSAGKSPPPPMPPVITSQPVSRTNLVGTTATFSVSAGGTQPLSYQWSSNNTNIANATNATLTLNNVQLSQAGSYSVLVTNALGSTNSSIAALTVVLPQSVPDPSGLVAWWPAEGNAIDVIGGNNGSPTGGISYTNGESGQAFNFAGTGYIPVPASPSLNLGTNAGLTIECWIKPAAGVNAPVIEWDSSTSDGLQLWIANGDTQLFSNIKDTSGNNHLLSFNYTFNTNNFQYVALTYDKNSGSAFLYINGTNVASANFGNVTPQATYPVNIGRRTGQPVGNGDTYGGLLDELSLYNRALSSNEIAGIYNAGSAGKSPPPPMPPVITSQPASRTNIVGTTASFSVTAGGTQPLSYQWSCNATNIASATNATLTLSNVQLSQAGNYSVLVTNLLGSTNSASVALTVVLPPTILTQPQSLAVASFQSAAFSVAATGTGPLSYQWRKNGTNLVDGGNITGSITTNLHIAVVTLADAGNYDVVVKNPYATSNSVVALLTVPQTVLSIGSTNGISGSTVTVPVLMNALGVENALIASVSYQTNKLALQRVQLGQATSGAYFQEVDSQTNIGNVGFAILLNSGAVVPAGTQEVARLVFTALPVTSNTIASLTFSDSPDSRQLADNNGNSLPAIYQVGTVSLTPGEYAADVYPRPTGDHQVTLQDWLEVGRMVARLDIVTNSDEFLRADCAPRNAPDGVLTVADWVQAGRFALGLDPLTPVTPPVKSNLEITPHDGTVPTRTLQLGNVSAQRGQAVNVPVQLVCNTNENAVGMTVIYNTNQLQFISASLGSALANGLLNINTNMVSGTVGVEVAMSPGAALAAGTNEVAVLQFLTSANAYGTAPLTLDNSVIQLQVADNTAAVLAANYVNGSVMLPPPPTLQTLMTANNLQLTWPASSGSFLLQSADNLSGPWSNVAIPIITNGSSATVTVQATNQQQFYRLISQ